jgi:hypothetical protein
MRIYVAAPWIRRADAKDVALRLKDDGHFVQSIWHDQHQDTDDPMTLAREAQVDFVGVISSDIVLVLNLEKSEGKAVEQGVAIGFEIPIMVVGERSNIFHYLPVVTLVPTVDAALAELRQLDARMA